MDAAAAGRDYAADAGAPGAGRSDPATASCAGAAASSRRCVPRAPQRASAGRPPMTATRRPAVHQVLATLGYGDAIGHEVLGIQRVLRAAGYESDIFVEAADLRLE